VALAQGGYADPHGQARRHYGAQPGTVYLIRPDGYVMGRWADAGAASSALRAAAPFYA
jgi:3-(3-hydroxy-phenyl)propionate hydroxylase